MVQEASLPVHGSRGHRGDGEGAGEKQRDGVHIWGCSSSSKDVKVELSRPRPHLQIFLLNGRRSSSSRHGGQRGANASSGRCIWPFSMACLASGGEAMEFHRRNLPSP